MTPNRFQYSSGSHPLAGLRVLVVGHRAPISAVLQRLEVPFAVWHNNPLKRPPTCLKSCSSPFPAAATDIRQFAERQFADIGPFTHVIAGTESAVYVASVCRRALNARKSKDSIALSCSDKQRMKSLMQANGVPMTDFLTQADSPSPQFIFDRLGPKVVVKQRINSGGRGISIADRPEQIAARKERGLMYERYVDANEMSIETFIHDREIRFISTTNYLVKTHANIVPGNIPADILDKALTINRQVIDALQLNWGLTHAEFYWTNESVLFGEVALRPPGGYIMECISLAHQFDAWEAFVANELGLPYSFATASSRTAGVALLHAGRGIVRAVENDTAVRKLSSCIRFKVLVKPGDKINQRIGVSEVSAYGLFVSDSATKTESDVMTCLEMVRFKLDSA